MDRKTFIKAGCMACTSVSFLATVLQSCSSVKYASGTLNENGLLVDLKDFESKGKQQNRSYLIVRHESLQYPICVYQIDANTYSALLMSCTHQGAELQVSGDVLTCPAHGSEFDKHGKVLQSPAASDLRSFPTTIINDQLFIDLRKKV